MTSTAYAPQPGTTAFRAIAYLQMHKLGTEMLNSHLAEALGIAPQSLHACMARALEARLVFARQKGGHARSPTFWSLVDHAAATVSDKAASLSPAAGNAAPAHRTTPVRDSQQVLKAEGDGPDATDRETPAMRSPVGGPTGAGQPAAAGPVEDPWAGYTERCPHGVRWENRCPTCRPHPAVASIHGVVKGKTGAPVPATKLADYVATIAERHPPDPAPATTKRGLRVAAWSTGELAIEIDGGEVIVFGKPEADQVVAFCRRIGGGL